MAQIVGKVLSSWLKQKQVAAEMRRVHPAGLPEGKEGLSKLRNPADTVFDCFASKKGQSHHPNEDRHVLCKNMIEFMEQKGTVISDCDRRLGNLRVYAVIDGHGGSGCADFIQSVLLGKIFDEWNFNSEIQSTPELMKRVAETALADIEEHFLSLAAMNLDTSGACVVLALYLDGYLCVSNVGDSMAIFYDHHGREMTVSQYHSHRNKAELARIKKAGGKIVKGYIEGQLQPSRTIGDLKMKTKHPGIVIPNPETVIVEVSKGEKFNPVMVLASDGLWDIGWKKSSFFIKQHVAFRNECMKSCEKQYGLAGFSDPASAIANYAHYSGSKDDITIVFAEFT